MEQPCSDFRRSLPGTVPLSPLELQQLLPWSDTWVRFSVLTHFPPLGSFLPRALGLLLFDLLQTKQKQISIQTQNQTLGLLVLAGSLNRQVASLRRAFAHVVLTSWLLLPAPTPSPTYWTNSSSSFIFK